MACDEKAARGLGTDPHAADANWREADVLVYLVLLCIAVQPVCTIDKDLVAASATPLVLAILADGESYGYAILKRVRELSGGELEWTDGMLYPLLHRLGRLGYVTTEWRTSAEGRRRKYYAITDEGRTALADQQRQWLAVTRALNDVWPGSMLTAVGRGMSVESLDSRIAEWRAYVAGAPGVNGHDVDELEDHLRHQIAELNAAGLTADEGFLIAVKRLGDVDSLSREFAREHSGRLWKQLLLGGEDEPARSSAGWVETLVFAVAAAVAVQVARLAAGAPDEEPTWLARNASLFVLPFLAGYFAHRRQLDARGWALTAAPFVARRARGQPLPVRRGLVDRDARRAPSPRRAVVRGRLPVHGRHASVPRAADGLRPLHGRVVHLLRADRARRRRAHGSDRCDPRAHGRRRRPDRRVGGAVGCGRRRDRGGVARRVEAACRREHGAGADDALHAAVRGDAGRRRRGLRRDRARRRVRPRPRRRLRRPAAWSSSPWSCTGCPRATRPPRRTGWTGSSWSLSSARSCSTCWCSAR